MAFVIGENEQEIEIQNVEVNYSQKGKPYVKIIFEDIADRDTIWWAGSFSDKAAERTVEQLKFLGFNAPSLVGLGQNWRNSFKSLRPDVSLSIDSYPDSQNQIKLKANWINKKIDKSQLGPDLMKFDKFLQPSKKENIDNALNKVQEKLNNGQQLQPSNNFQHGFQQNNNNNNNNNNQFGNNYQTSFNNDEIPF